MMSNMLKKIALFKCCRLFDGMRHALGNPATRFQTKASGGKAGTGMLGMLGLDGPGGGGDAAAAGHSSCGM